MEQEGIFLGAALEEKHILEYSPLVWAYVGDAVYEVMVRTHLTLESNVHVKKLHRNAIGFVSAKAQYDRLIAILDMLTEHEKDIVRRGRNSRSGTVPKNADINEYRYSTGLEALFGYLYLKKEFNRLQEIFRLLLQVNINT